MEEDREEEKQKKKQKSIFKTIQIQKVKSNIYLYLLKKIMRMKIGRDALVKKFQQKMRAGLMEDYPDYLNEVNEKRYQFFSAMLESVKRNVDKNNINPGVTDRIIDTLVRYSFASRKEVNLRSEPFRERYNMEPPSFVTISPTQKCNLKCEGCYASSTGNESCPTLSFEIVEKMCDEVYNEWGNRFMVFSGGEPLLFSNNGKSLFDIWEKYPDMFFLFYTNSTLINEERARKMAELGNITPAISIEGFEKETDRRRGKGTFQKILKAFENLRKVGLPFGVSVTATQKNINILFDDKFYDFVFQEQGASYMWMFQLMPIGQAKNTKKMMITPEQRVQLYRKWDYLLKEKKYCIADFWNSSALSNGCIAYGRSSGYLYIDWNGNIMPCVFVPYYQDNIKDLYNKGKKLADALFSSMFVNGRKWQDKYGRTHPKTAENGLMPCSIRDHFHNFKQNIFQGKGEDEIAEQAIHSEEYEKTLEEFDEELETLTRPIWKKEYLEKG